MLTQRYERLVRESFGAVFAQERSVRRAVEHALAMPCAMGRRTISRTICALDRQHLDWSAEYKLYSRSPWEADLLFDPVLEDYLARFPGASVAVALDDTKMPKSGRKIPGASWQRDPMSPPFHTNLLYSLRFLQASLLFPLWRLGDHSTRAIPAQFRDVPVVKKPGKRASDEERAAWREARKAQNLSVHAVESLRSLRAGLDRLGAGARRLLAALDGSFCNRTVFRAALERTDLMARCRKDARLCRPAPPGGRRLYDERKFTPEEVRRDETIPWKTVRVHYGGAWREVRYKELTGVLWQRGSGVRPLRFLVFAPQPYKSSPNGPTNYHEAAYYLSTDLTSPAAVLAQAAFDRWQIEVNHREEKQGLGVGQAQVRSPRSVERHPAFAVAVYSLLHLAGLQEYGPARTADYVALPKWRRNARRPSYLDLASLLRKETQEMASLSGSPPPVSTPNTVLYAYT